jgi:hypothetical protein
MSLTNRPQDISGKCPVGSLYLSEAQTLSYEHYYPYGGTTLIAGKDKAQVQQKRYRYTGKERDDSSGLSSHLFYLFNTNL